MPKTARNVPSQTSEGWARGRVRFLHKTFVASKRISEADFRRALQYDSSHTKRYVQWMLVRLEDGRLLSEDLYKLEEGLRAFDRHKQRLPQALRDINTFRGHRDFLDAMDPFIATPTERELQRDEKAAIRREIRVVHDDADGQVLVPETERAACFLGHGTRWCTASTKSENFFGFYHARGPLYVLIPRIPKSERPADGHELKYQFHLSSAQLHNPLEHEVAKDKVAEEYPEMWASIQGDMSPDDRARALEDTPKAIAFLDETTEAERLTAVSGMGSLLEHIEGASLAVVRAALSSDGTALEFVADRTLDLCILAMRKSPRAIEWAPDPTPQMMMAAVRHDGLLLQHVAHRATADVLRAAIARNPSAVRYAVNPSEELVEQALRLQGRTLGYVRDRITPRLERLAIEQDGTALEFVTHYTPELAMAAVRQNGDAIPHVRREDLNAKVMHAAISQKPAAIRHLKEARLPKSVQCLAARRDPRLVLTLADPCAEAVAEAVRQDGHLIANFPNAPDAVKREALAQNPHALVHLTANFPNAPDAVKREALAHLTTGVSRGLVLFALARNGHAIAYVWDPDAEMQMTAVCERGTALGYIDDPASGVVAAAIERTPAAARFAGPAEQGERHHASGGAHPDDERLDATTDHEASSPSP